MAKRTLNGTEIVRTDTKKAKRGCIRVKLRKVYGDRTQTWCEEIPIEKYKKEVTYHTNEVKQNDTSFLDRRLQPQHRTDG